MIAPAFTPTAASLFRALARYREIAARWPAPWPVAAAPRPTAHAQALLDAERLVLGAVLTGALTLADLHRAPDDLCGHLRHRRVLGVLVSLLEMRAAGRDVPGAPGLDVDLAESTCARAKVWALGVVTTSPPRLCSLSDLMFPPPRRAEAETALKLLSAEVRHRADVRAERARLREALHGAVGELVAGYLVAALHEASASGSTEIVASRGHRPWIGPDVLREEIARHRQGRGVAHEMTDEGGVN